MHTDDSTEPKPPSQAAGSTALEQSTTPAEKPSHRAKIIVGIVCLSLVGALAVVIGRDAFTQAYAESNVRSAGDEPEFVDEQDVGFVDERDSWGQRDVAALSFDDYPEPTLAATLAELGDDRIREIEFFLPAGDGGVSFAIRNPEPIRLGGQGIAVRTDEFAQLLHSSMAFEMPRPVECIDGQCRLFMWLTMGPQFLGEHPDAELLIWAGEGAAVTIEPMPMGNIRDETFR